MIIKTRSYGHCDVILKQYENGRTAVILNGPLGAMVLSVNLPNEPLEDEEFFVKGWSENEEIIEDCRPYFIDTGKRVPTGFVTAEVWRFKNA